jgi:hypothetical protein
MKQLFFILLASFGVVYMVGGVLLYLFQSSFIYYPTPEVKHPYPEKTLRMMVK